MRRVGVRMEIRHVAATSLEQPVVCGHRLWRATKKTLRGDDLSGPGSPERRNQSETSPVNTSVLTTPTAVTTATFPRFRQQVNE